jgi:hypothetical protein
MKQLENIPLSDELVFQIRGAAEEHGWNGSNILCEWDDNSIGYGGTLVYNKLIKNPNGTYRIVRANNGSKCSIHDFKTRFIGKTLKKIERNRNKSNGQALMGGSISVHGHSYYEEIGFCTPDGKYIVSLWNYKHFDSKHISDLQLSEFESGGQISGIEVTLYEVTRDEFVKRHGLGKSYNGWYNISNTFQGLRFKVNPQEIFAFSRERYQYKDTKVTYHFEDGDNVDIQTKKKFYFPSADGVNVQHYTDMTEVVDESGDNFHEISTSTENFEFELYHYNTVRKSDTDKMLTLKSQYGVSDLNPTHFNKLSFPTIDVVSSDGTYITQIEKFPGKSEERWDPKWNNGKYVMVLSSESASPFARMKVKFKNTAFEIEVRKKIDKLAELNNLWSETSGVAAKKQEDREVERFVKIVKDDTEKSNFITVGNVEKLIGTTLDTSTIIPQNNDEYQHKLDITFGKDFLIEWQKDSMDDEHYSELISRITMKHDFKRIVWVHGGLKESLKNKLENHLANGRVNMIGIEKVILIDKNDFYKENGFKNAVEAYTNK